MSYMMINHISSLPACFLFYFLIQSFIRWALIGKLSKANLEKENYFPRKNLNKAAANKMDLHFDEAW